MICTRLADRDIASVAIAAGPEGGFTEDEVALAREQGYVPVRLGGRILRCETASIAAVSIAQFLWGDLYGEEIQVKVKVKKYGQTLKQERRLTKT